MEVVRILDVGMQKVKLSLIFVVGSLRFCAGPDPSFHFSGCFGSGTGYHAVFENFKVDTEMHRMIIDV
jgi:hypothetical protein